MSTIVRLKRMVPVTVAYRVEVRVPADWDTNMIQFHVEENRCLDNYIVDLAARIEAGPDVCHTCCIGDAVVGIVSLEKVPARAGTLDRQRAVDDGPRE